MFALICHPLTCMYVIPEIQSLGIGQFRLSGLATYLVTKRNEISVFSTLHTLM
jgi:hypothetical protein